MATYSWLSKTAAVFALQDRLKSANGGFWSDAECEIYIWESLRHWNGLTEQWNSLFPINNANGQWINTGTAANSPRIRTVTDQYLYGQMCSMLMEPQLSAGAWAGTNQFTLQNLQYCLQKRTQEVIQAASCNLAQLSPIDATPGVNAGYALDDGVEAEIGLLDALGDGLRVFTEQPIDTIGVDQFAHFGGAGWVRSPVLPPCHVDA